MTNLGYEKNTDAVEILDNRDEISSVCNNTTAKISGEQCKEFGMWLLDIFNNIQPFVEKANFVGKAIVEFAQQFDLDAILNHINSLNTAIMEAAKSLNVLSITEEEKQRLIANSKRWGELGWTTNPCEGNLLFYVNPPFELKAADKIAMDRCRNIIELFAAIEGKKRVKKEDFSEAVADFKESKYKSCALLLFSLIDAQLIRFQPRKETGGKRRNPGASALKIIKKRVGYGEKDEALFISLFYMNLFSSIEIMFKNGNDFKKQPPIINRNFLSHGMMTSRVTKKSCIQLFLVYYNMLELQDIIYC